MNTERRSDMAMTSNTQLSSHSIGKQKKNTNKQTTLETKTKIKFSFKLVSEIPLSFRIISLFL